MDNMNSSSFWNQQPEKMPGELDLEVSEQEAAARIESKFPGIAFTTEQTNALKVMYMERAFLAAQLKFLRGNMTEFLQNREVWLAAIDRLEQRFENTTAAYDQVVFEKNKMILDLLDDKERRDFKIHSNSF